MRCSGTVRSGRQCMRPGNPLCWQHRDRVAQGAPDGHSAEGTQLSTLLDTGPRLAGPAFAGLLRNPTLMDAAQSMLRTSLPTSNLLAGPAFAGLLRNPTLMDAAQSMLRTSLPTFDVSNPLAGPRVARVIDTPQSSKVVSAALDQDHEDLMRISNRMTAALVAFVLLLVVQHSGTAQHPFDAATAFAMLYGCVYKHLNRQDGLR